MHRFDSTDDLLQRRDKMTSLKTDFTNSSIPLAFEEANGCPQNRRRKNINRLNEHNGGFQSCAILILRDLIPVCQRGGK